MMLRGSRVLARVQPNGELSVDGGRVEVRYKPNDGRSYRALARNLEPIAGSELLPDDACADASPVAAVKKGAARAAPAEVPAKVASPRAHASGDGEIIVYADGACSGNPGPAGLGVVILDGEKRRELSEYLGDGTNNIAELTALLRGMDAVADGTRPVILHTDSRYAIGMIKSGWRVKANHALVAKVREAYNGLGDRAELVYVPGHAGVELNERADELAREAVATRRTRPWHDVV